VSFDLLDIVVLTTDDPAHGLKRGDLGTVVHAYDADAFEVEFVTAAGETKAVLTLPPDAVRRVNRNDLLSVRSLTGAA